MGRRMRSQKLSARSFRDGPEREMRLLELALRNGQLNTGLPGDYYIWLQP